MRKTVKRISSIIGFSTVLVIVALVSIFIFVDFDGDNASFFANDCQPFDSLIGPSSKEISFDGIDQNCDGDDYVEGDTADNDGDGFNVVSGDCDDRDPSVYNAAPEIFDDKDNDCDGRIDEKLITLTIIDSPFIPTAGTKRGIVGLDFLRGISAFKLQSSGPIYDGYLNVSATTTSSNAPNSGSKSVAVKIYLGLGSTRSFQPLDERYLDAAWTGNGTNALNASEAGERGGVFFAGQTRELRLNIRSLPVTAKSQLSSIKESLNLVNLISEYGDELIMGFYTSAPGFGVINSASFEFEVDETTNVELIKL